MMRWPSQSTSIRSPRPTHPSLRKLPPKPEPVNRTSVGSGKNRPPWIRIRELLASRGMMVDRILGARQKRRERLDVMHENAVSIRDVLHEAVERALSRHQRARA